jgi:hypothetical protein
MRSPQAVRWLEVAVASTGQRWRVDHPTGMSVALAHPLRVARGAA